jgi:hypothetical protein
MFKGMQMPDEYERFMNVFRCYVKGLKKILREPKKSYQFVPATVLHRWGPHLDPVLALEETRAGQL